MSLGCWDRAGSIPRGFSRELGNAAKHRDNPRHPPSSQTRPRAPPGMPFKSQHRGRPFGKSHRSGRVGLREAWHWARPTDQVSHAWSRLDSVDRLTLVRLGAGPWTSHPPPRNPSDRRRRAASQRQSWRGDQDPQRESVGTGSMRRQSWWHYAASATPRLLSRSSQNLAATADGVCAPASDRSPETWPKRPSHQAPRPRVSRPHAFYIWQT